MSSAAVSDLSLARSKRIASALPSRSGSLRGPPAGQGALRIPGAPDSASSVRPRRGPCQTVSANSVSRGWDGNRRRRARYRARDDPVHAEDGIHALEADGAVLERTRTRRFQSRDAVLLAQRQHAQAATEGLQRMTALSQQALVQDGAARPDGHGAGGQRRRSTQPPHGAPVAYTHRPWWKPLESAAHVALQPLPAQEDFHSADRDTHTDLGACMMLSHRVVMAVGFDVIIWTNPRHLSSDVFVGAHRQRPPSARRVVRPSAPAIICLPVPTAVASTPPCTHAAVRPNPMTSIRKPGCAMC